VVLVDWSIGNGAWALEMWVRGEAGAAIMDENFGNARVYCNPKGQGIEQDQ